MHTTLPNTDRSNLAQEGITKNCALAFSKTAEDNNCIVMTRTPGKACLQLLEEGYDAKGFHVKAKSCNWGPMSGFICVHPLFNKKGFQGFMSNMNSNEHSLRDSYEADLTSSVSPIIISQAQKAHLETHQGEKLSFEPIPMSQDFNAICQVPYAEDGNVVHFMLKSLGSGLFQLFVKKAALEKLLMVLLIKGFPKELEKAKQDSPRSVSKLKENKEKYFDSATKKGTYPPLVEKKIIEFWQARKKYPGGLAITPKSGDDYEAVYAMTNPHLTYSLSSDEFYKNALTGDFDLFAAWPDTTATTYDVEDDKRIAGMNRMDDLNNHIARRENKFNIKSPQPYYVGRLLGNISNRVFHVGQSINSLCANYSKKTHWPNRVYHSDEGGRPFLDELDECAVFLPSSLVIELNLVDFMRTKKRIHNEIFFSSEGLEGTPQDTKRIRLEAFKKFLKCCSEQNYNCFVNPAWRADLGEHYRYGIISEQI